MSCWEDYNKAFLTDGIRFMLGDYLGKGMSREVYVYGINSQFVIKVETEATSRFQNVIEYNFWDENRYVKDVMKWIAPCAQISPHGNWMIQERTTPISIDELRRRVKKIPCWLSDSKDANWGRLPNGRIVCHDYGTHLAIQNMSHRLRKPIWWTI